MAAALHSRAPVDGALEVSDEQECGFGGSVQIPQRLLDNGSPATDVLILVTARPTAGSALAFAGHCQEDGGFSDGQYVPRRPTVGHMNVDPSAIRLGAGVVDTPDAVEALLMVLLHEAFHVLGFAHDKLVQLPCPNAPSFDRFERVRAAGRRARRLQGGAPAHDPYDPAAYGLRACSLAGSPEPVINATSGLSTHPRRLLATPRVLATARRHFNCTVTGSASADACAAVDDCLVGLPLEDCRGSGDCTVGEGTAGSHWEKRVMHGDVMVGVAGGAKRTSISDLTLAVFADAGWYEPNMDVASPRCFYQPAWCADGNTRHPWMWGRDRGCAFVSGSCDGPAWRGAPGYWCAADPRDAALTPSDQRAFIDAEGCTLGRLAVGRCTLREHSAPVPPPFRYFGDALPNLGGPAMEDYCPTWEGYADWDCSVPSSSDAVLSAARLKGEARGDASRCFKSTLYNASALLASPYHGCYTHRCLSEERLQLRVDGQWHDCAERVVISGWSGSIECPPTAELCARAADLHWPSIHAVRPSRGPDAGGTSITISGRSLHAPSAAPRSSANAAEASSNEMGSGSGEADGSVAGISSGVGDGSATDDSGGAGDGGGGEMPRVLICGQQAIGVQVAPPDEDSNATTSSSSSWQRLVAFTPALASPTDVGSTLNVSCHVTVLTLEGREALALNAFRYERVPEACTILSVETFEWSVPHLTSLYVCLWPYVLCAIAGLWVLHSGWRARARLAVLRSIERDHGGEVTFERDEPL